MAPAIGGLAGLRIEQSLVCCHYSSSRIGLRMNNSRLTQRQTGAILNAIAEVCLLHGIVSYPHLIVDLS